MLRRAKGSGDEDGSGRHVSQDQSAVVPAQSKGLYESIDNLLNLMRKDFNRMNRIYRMIGRLADGSVDKLSPTESNRVRVNPSRSDLIRLDGNGRWQMANGKKSQGSRKNAVGLCEFKVFQGIFFPQGHSNADFGVQWAGQGSDMFAYVRLCSDF